MSLFCNHEWNEINGTRHLYNGGTSKEARFKCSKCPKKKWFDIFKVPKTIYIFRESNKGYISDGSHTFEELYNHRMILFAVICNTYKDKSWKSKLHSDGTMYDDYFIVGIETEKGSYSYHYSIDSWDIFNVKELKNAPEWDGHIPDDVDRLLSLI